MRLIPLHSNHSCPCVGPISNGFTKVRIRELKIFFFLVSSTKKHEDKLERLAIKPHFGAKEILSLPLRLLQIYFWCHSPSNRREFSAILGQPEQPKQLCLHLNCFYLQNIILVKMQVVC